jgi:peroxiredoxin
VFSFVSCDRREVATAILTVGFSRTNSSGADSAWQTGTLPEKELLEFGNTTVSSPLDEIWSELQRLREPITANDPALLPETFVDLIGRLEKLIAGYEQTDGAKEQLQSAREAKLTALSIGASAHPLLYSSLRDDFYRELFQAEYDSETAANASVQQFVTGYLAKTRTNPRTAAALAQHVTAHPDCQMNVQLYMTTVERLANEDQFAAAMRLGSQGLKLCASQPGVSRLDEQIKNLRAANPGLPGDVMQFTSPTVRGPRFDLASLRGRPVLVVFWATWCPGCVKEAPEIKEFYERYHDEGLEVVGVSLDVNREELAAFVNNQQLPWPQMFSNHPGNEAWNNPIAKHYGVESIPCAFLLDEQGTIVASHLQNGSTIEAAILKQLSR